MTFSAKCLRGCPVPQWILVCCAALLSVIGFGLSATPSAAANANKCVQWNSPQKSYARNLCNKRIEVRWKAGDRTILANDVASGMNLNGGSFIACFYPETDVATGKNGKYYCKPRKQAAVKRKLSDENDGQFNSGPSTQANINQCQKGFRSCTSSCQGLSMSNGKADCLDSCLRTNDNCIDGRAAKTATSKSNTNQQTRKLQKSAPSGSYAECRPVSGGQVCLNTSFDRELCDDLIYDAQRNVVQKPGFKYRYVGGVKTLSCGTARYEVIVGFRR